MPKGKPTKLPAIITQAQSDLFWSKVDVRGENECWPWTGQILKDYGYGQFRLDKKLRSVRAHRLAFRLFWGGDPYEADVCHTCDNRLCCNSLNHHFLGTRSDNNADRHKKGRTKRGFDLKHTKLSEEQKATIKQRLESGEIGRRLAKEYGVCPASICLINKNQAIR